MDKSGHVSVWRQEMDKSGHVSVWRQGASNSRLFVRGWAVARTLDGKRRAAQSQDPDTLAAYAAESVDTDAHWHPHRRFGRRFGRALVVRWTRPHRHLGLIKGLHCRGGRQGYAGIAKPHDHHRRLDASAIKRRKHGVAGKKKRISREYFIWKCPNCAKAPTFRRARQHVDCGETCVGRRSHTNRVTCETSSSDIAVIGR